MVITPILRLFLNPSIRLTKKCHIINGAMLIANKRNLQFTFQDAKKNSLTI